MTTTSQNEFKCGQDDENKPPEKERLLITLDKHQNLYPAEQREDSPVLSEKQSNKCFSLVAQPVPQEGLKDITNIERPALFLSIGNQDDKLGSTNEQNSSNLSPTVISPTTKAALISAGTNSPNP